MSDGLIALTGWQAGFETVRGTPVAATRIQPMEASMQNRIERFAPTEDRNSFEEYFRSSQTKQHVEISGGKMWLTFEDAAWLNNLAIRGAQHAGVLSDTAAYTYTFQPANGVDDLDSMTFEGFNDTSAWAVPFTVLKKVDFNWQRGQPVQVGLDFLGQQMTTQAKTAALTQRLTEDVETGATTAYIDPTTIGSTAVADVLDAKVTLDNMWEPLYPLNGTLYPSKFVRSKRHMAGEFTLEFDTTTEYTAAVAGTKRLIRLTSLGTLITGAATTHKSVVYDFYTQGWDTFDFGRQGGIWTVKFVGRSTDVNNLGYSFKSVVINGNATVV
jgi:hypothetical protein